MPLSGGAAPPRRLHRHATGTDYWVATYNGDANNAAVSPAARRAGDDQPGHPGDHHQPAAGIATVGTSIADKATVSGGYNPTGTVTFELSQRQRDRTAARRCSPTPSAAQRAPPCATSGRLHRHRHRHRLLGRHLQRRQQQHRGHQRLRARAGDHQPGHPGDHHQPAAGGPVGTSIADKATVTGGYNPTGTVTFDLYSNATATGTPLFTATNAARAGGARATSVGFTATATGTDYWVATYNGDTNNTSVSSG